MFFNHTKLLVEKLFIFVFIKDIKWLGYKNDQDFPDQMRRGADAWEKEILISDKFLEEREESPLLEFYTWQCCQKWYNYTIN